MNTIIPAEKKVEFHKALCNLINSFSLENQSDTPDWLLADYLVMCLDNWNFIVEMREHYYGRDKRSLPVSQWPKVPGNPVVRDDAEQTVNKWKGKA